MIYRKKEQHEMGKVGNAKLDSKVIDGNGMGQLFNYFIKKTLFELSLILLLCIVELDSLDGSNHWQRMGRTRLNRLRTASAFRTCDRCVIMGRCVRVVGWCCVHGNSGGRTDIRRSYRTSSTQQDCHLLQFLLPRQGKGKWVDRAKLSPRSSSSSLSCTKFQAKASSSTLGTKTIPLHHSNSTSIHMHLAGRF
ncbi:unnamed protein product [Prunus brigantina]